jgi:hypothetical protein
MERKELKHMETQFINTGGGCVIRLIQMNGFVLAISDELIIKYESFDAFWETLNTGEDNYKIIAEL